jgi:hypothetical protein
VTCSDSFMRSGRSSILSCCSMVTPSGNLGTEESVELISESLRGCVRPAMDWRLIGQKVTESDVSVDSWLTSTGRRVKSSLSRSSSSRRLIRLPVPAIWYIW